MPTSPTDVVLRYLRKLTAAEQARERPDGELLERFTARGDQAAFETLVRRHGPVVWRLCQRVLHNEHDAADAFQATFLVLSRKAGSLRRQQSVGSWLYRVAYRLAQKARTSAGRRRAHERQATPRPGVDPLADLTQREVQAILDQELARLPDKYRAPLVLCCLEGLSRDEAAHQLGLPLSTVKSRLEEARERLRARLAARGLTLTSALTAVVFSEPAAAAAVPAALLEATVQGATLWAAGGSATGLVSAQAAALTAGVCKTLVLTRLTLATGVLLAVGVLTAGTGALLWQAQATGQPEARKAGGPAAAEMPRGAAAAPHADVPKILARFQALQPDAKDLALFCLDWMPTLKAAQEKAAREQRPLLLLTVTNSYGNLYTGHC